MSTRGLVLAGVAGVVAWAVLALVNKKDKDSQKNKADNAVRTRAHLSLNSSERSPLS